VSVDRYTNIIACPGLAPMAAVVVPHGLISNGSGLVPNFVLADRSTPVACIAVDDVSCTFQNNGTAPGDPLNFLVEVQFSTQRDPDEQPPFL